VGVEARDARSKTGDGQVMSGDRGLLYAACGAKYVAEAVASRESARRVMPDVPAVLFTDDPGAVAGGVFERVERCSGEGRVGHKLDPMRRSPFDKTLFIDSDTHVVEELEDVFAVLDRFDVAVAFDSARWPYGERSLAEGRVPRAFPEYNSGVLGFRRSAETARWIERWIELYEEQAERWPGFVPDQPTLQVSLYESDLRIATLPPEYNFRTNYVAFCGAHTRVKVLHGREFDLAELAERVNATADRHPHVARVFLWSERQLFEPVLNFMKRERWLTRLLRGRGA
jgi:hypothetical protein